MLVLTNTIRFSKSLEDKMTERDIPAAKSLIQTKYTVIVCTGDVTNAGTDANVFITLFGDKVVQFKLSTVAYIH